MKRVSKEGVKTILNVVLKPRILYPLKTMTMSEVQVKEIQKLASELWRNAYKISGSAPRDLFEPLLDHKEWFEEVTQQQTMTLLTEINQSSSTLKTILEQAVERRQEWAGVGHPVLESPYFEDIGEDYTWLGHVHMALARRGFQVEGGKQRAKEEMHKENGDVNLIEVAPKGMRAMVMQVGRLLNVHWLSEVEGRENVKEEDMTRGERDLVRRWKKWVATLKKDPNQGPRTRGTKATESTHIHTKRDMTHEEITGEWEAGALTTTKHLMSMSDGSSHPGTQKGGASWMVYVGQEEPIML
jgi:hypothetical protein